MLVRVRFCRKEAEAYFRQNCTLTDLGYIRNVDRVLIFDFKISKGVKMNLKVEETLFYTLYPREKLHISVLTKEDVL